MSERRHAIRATVIVTAGTLAAQGLAFATQVAIAAAFGAGADMDAFMAANTLPQYIVGVLVGVLAAVFIPAFLDYRATGREEEAWVVVHGVLLVLGTLFVALAIIGVVFTRPLLSFTTPGLSAASLDAAARVARIAWPSILATGLATLFTGVYQAEKRFTWPAAAPAIGAFANLILVLILAKPFGVLGVAIAALVGVVLQALLLVPIVFAGRAARFWGSWKHPGVTSVVITLWPVVVAGLVTRWTPVLDRFYASQLSEGSISHLSYAFRIATLMSMLLATGISTVLYPRLAGAVASADDGEFRRTASRWFSAMWLVVAPSVAMVLALSDDMITAVFRRGAFTSSDASAVASLLRIYALALPAMCFGTVTGRIFYAQKRTRLLAVAGVAEALAYAVYTPILANRFGVRGIAGAYVIYFTVSLTWQILVLLQTSRATGLGRELADSLARSGIAAAIGGLAALGASAALTGVWWRLTLGGISGGVAFLAVLFLMGSPELHTLAGAASDLLLREKPRAQNPAAAPPVLP